jgi:hypothetical protein
MTLHGSEDDGNRNIGTLSKFVLSAVENGFIFWDITLRSSLEVNCRFGGTCRLHPKGRRICPARNQQKAKRDFKSARSGELQVCNREAGFVSCNQTRTLRRSILYTE